MIKRVLFLAGLLASTLQLHRAESITAKHLDFSEHFDVFYNVNQSIKDSFSDQDKVIFKNPFLKYVLLPEVLQPSGFKPGKNIIADISDSNSIRLVKKPVYVCETCSQTILNCTSILLPTIKECPHIQIESATTPTQKRLFQECPKFENYTAILFNEDSGDFVVIFNDGRNVVLFEDIWNENKCVIDYQSFAGKEDVYAVNAAAHLWETSRRFRDATINYGVGGVEDVFGCSPATWGEVDLLTGQPPQEHSGTPTNPDVEAVD